MPFTRHQAPKGPPGPQGEAGTGLTGRGGWVSGETYEPNDFVFDRSSDDPDVNSMWIVQAGEPFVSTVQPWEDPVNWVEFQAPAGEPGMLPDGTAAGNTPFWDGSQWVVTSNNLFNDGNNIGIGTAEPSQKLDVDGDIRLRGHIWDSGNLPGGSGQVLVRGDEGIIWQDMPDSGITGSGTAGNIAYWSGVSSLGSLPYILYGDDESVKIASKEDADDDDPIFEVKNRDGNVVFGVYQTGVRIYVDEKDTGKGSRAGFAVGGFTRDKGDEIDYLRVDPGFVRINIDDEKDPVKGEGDESKGARAGFAVGGFSTSKQSDIDYFSLTPASAQFLLDERDPSKGARAGFAVGGFTSSKDGTNDYFKISGTDVPDVIDSEARILWYPQKEAFLTGRVLIEDPGDVGQNSTVTGYHSKASGDWSQAFGYEVNAAGRFSTAIGNNSAAIGESSFALGIETIASGSNSFALGRMSEAAGNFSVAIGNSAVASGHNSFSVGEGSVAGNVKLKNENSYAFGKNSHATGARSYALGEDTEATETGSYAFGFQAKSTAGDAFAIGRSSEASGIGSFAIGFIGLDTTGVMTGPTKATGDWSIAVGMGSQATSQGGVAIGTKSMSEGDYSLAMGLNSEASGRYSFAFGNNASATYIGSYAIGNNAVSSGLNSFAIGRLAEATGTNSVAIGVGSSRPPMITKTRATGLWSFALGGSATSTGEHSFAIGNRAESKGRYSYAIGRETIADSYGEIVVGYNNEISGGEPSEPDPRDPLFVIGNGTSPSERSNALTVLKNGRVGIGVTEPSYQLQLSLDSAAKPGTNTWTVPSDIRLKDIKGEYEKGLEEILLLNPIVYRYKDNNPLNIEQTGKDAVGFSAQDVKKVFPEAVKINDQGYLLLDIHSILIAQINAIKSLNDKIGQQEAVNEMLKAQLDRFRENPAQLDQIRALKDQQQQIHALQEENRYLREQVDMILQMLSTAEADK